jgi:hypothetical protein
MSDLRRVCATSFLTDFHLGARLHDMPKNKSKVATEAGSVSTVSRKNALRFLAGKTAVAGAAGAPTTEIVAARAYSIYLEEGRPEGRHLEHWLRAESELRV